MFDWLTAPLASAASGIAGFLGQQETNATNRQLAADNTAFQERMSNTAYQRQVKDMEAAGLNPMLSYVKGGGASTPTGSVAQVQSPAAAGVQSAYSSAQTSLAHKQVPKVEAETSSERNRTLNIAADTWLKQAQTGLATSSAAVNAYVMPKLEAEARKISTEIRNLDTLNDKLKAEIVNLPLEGKRLVALAAELTARVPLINAQAATEVERKNQLMWLAGKTMRESDLLQKDLEAIEKADNLGRRFGQYKPALDTILSFIAMLRR